MAEVIARVPPREQGKTSEGPKPEVPKSQTPPPPPTRKKSRLARSLVMFLLGGAVLTAGWFGWKYFSKPGLPEGFAGGNGRLEANQVFIASKYPGRIAEVLFDEGDTVNTGQVVARMDTTALEAQLREAEAQIVAAEGNIKAAEGNVKAAEDTRKVALAQVAAREAEYTYASQQYERSRALVPQGAVSSREAELDLSTMATTNAQLAGAQAEATKTISAIDAAKASADAARATADAARATADRLRAEISDSVLRSPIRARVESRLAEPGEVLAQGGRVLSILDLSDVYMYVYLPESVTGKVPLGSESRIVLDAAPSYPIRTTVSYVSPVAQFTPKTVETAEERHNLTFRVKLQLDKDRLREFEPLVKSGLPGMGYVRFTNAQWPADLQWKEPPANLWQPTGSAGAKAFTGAPTTYYGSGGSRSGSGAGYNTGAPPKPLVGERE